MCAFTHPGDKEGKRVTTVMATVGKPPDRQQEISYSDIKAIGNGSFGVVYQARLIETNESVAIKKVLQDKRFKNRELQIMRRLDHCNIIRLQYFFYSNGDKVSPNKCVYTHSHPVCQPDKWCFMQVCTMYIESLLHPIRLFQIQLVKAF